MEAACADIRELVAAMAIHHCSPSCFKYHSRGRTQICRHNFYHVLALLDYDGSTDAKAARNCVPVWTS